MIWSELILKLEWYAILNQALVLRVFSDSGKSAGKWI
jgi:hypothetical protein